MGTEEPWRQITLGLLRHDIMRPLESILDALDRGSIQLKAGRAVRRSILDELESIMVEIQTCLSDEVQRAYSAIADSKVGREIANRAVQSHLIKPFNRVAERVDKIMTSCKTRLDAAIYDEIRVGLRRYRALLLTMHRLIEEGLEPRDETTNLKRIVEDIFKFYKKSEPDGDLSVRGEVNVRSDSGQIWSIFDNIISNAVRHAGERSPTIEVRHSCISPSQLVSKMADRLQSVIDVSQWSESGVRDHGIGIPVNKTDAIFQLGRQLVPEDYRDSKIGALLKSRKKSLPRERSLRHALQAQDSGLGLGLVHFFVVQNRGVIAVDSREGGPTTFGIWLPRSSSAPESKSTQPFDDVWWRQKQ